MQSPHRLFRLLCVCFLFGAAIYSIVWNGPDCTDQKQICSYRNRTVELTGVVGAEPDRRIMNTRYALAVESVKALGQTNPALGRVLVAARNYPEYHHGDRLTVLCRLRWPDPNENEGRFRYDKYLIKEGYSAICTANKTAFVGKTETSRVKSGLLAIKEKVAERINALWGEPEASFMAGLLYGSRAGLPADILAAFNAVGLTHLIAVSGFNLSIIAVVLISAAIYAGAWRGQASYGVAAAIWLFVVFTGGSASVTRAAAMASLVILGERLGRPTRSANILLCAAALMAAFNPFIVLWDAGFQLSFLSTWGLMFVAPRLKEYAVFSRLPSFLESVLVPTLSAIIATMPLTLYQFGRVSLMAPLANLLVAPIIPWLMLFGFSAVVLSIVVFPLGQLVAWVAALGLDYGILIAQTLGAVPGGSLSLSIPLVFMCALYGLLFLWLKKYRWSRLARATIWRPANTTNGKNI